VSVLAIAGSCAAQGEGAKTGVTPPPAIYLPAGGKVVTEINLSDDDVLGIIKDSIPAAAGVAKDLVAVKMGANPEAAEAMSSAIDTTGLMEAISGITNVRVLIARYPSGMSPERFVKEFSAGVAKAGQFHKVLTDFGFSPGAAGLYALPDNAGSMAFAYDPNSHTAYAARVVGGLDVPKLIKWGGNIAKAFMTSGVKHQPESEGALVPPEAAPPATENQ